MLSFCKNSVYNIEAGIHKLEFTAYIYLIVYSGILQGSLQKVLKVGTVLLWSWQMHVWSTLTLSFCPMTGWHINWGLYTFGKQPYSISDIESSTVLDIYQMMLQVTISGSCRSLRTNQYLKRFHLARWNSIFGDYHLIIKCSKTPFPFLVLPLVRVPRILPLTISNQPLVEDRYLLLLLGE